MSIALFLFDFIFKGSFDLTSGAVKTSNLANIYLFKVNNENSRKRCKVCLKLPMKTSE